MSQPRVGEKVRESATLLGASSTPMLDSEILVGTALRLDRVGLRVHSERELTADEAAAVDALILRRREGEPVAYIIGSSWFYGLELYVDHRVLVPRPETELLVDFALERAQQMHAEASKPPVVRIADICTGSGCIAVAISSALSAKGIDSYVVGVDLSADALAVASANGQRFAPGVEFVHGDLLSPLASSEPFDIIVANPPYVASPNEPGLAPEVRDFEPHLALFADGEGGVEGLLRSLSTQAWNCLADGGVIAIEHGQHQRAMLSNILNDVGFVDVAGIDDLAGIDRVVTGRRQAGRGEL